MTDQMNGTHLSQVSLIKSKPKYTEETHVDMLYFAAWNNPARTYPTTAAPMTAFNKFSVRNKSRTKIAKVIRERALFAFGGVTLYIVLSYSVSWDERGVEEGV